MKSAIRSRSSTGDVNVTFALHPDRDCLSHVVSLSRNLAETLRNREFKRRFRACPPSNVAVRTRGDQLK